MANEPNQPGRRKGYEFSLRSIQQKMKAKEKETAAEGKGPSRPTIGEEGRKHTSNYQIRKGTTPSVAAEILERQANAQELIAERLGREADALRRAESPRLAYVEAQARAQRKVVADTRARAAAIAAGMKKLSTRPAPSPRGAGQPKSSAQGTRSTPSPRRPRRGGQR